MELVQVLEVIENLCLVRQLGHQSPIAKSCGALPVSVQSYSITVGAGGGKGIRDTIGTNGVNSTFSTITSAGGGFGGMQAGSPNTQFLPGGPGGSGGAAGYQNGPVLQHAGGNR